MKTVKVVAVYFGLFLISNSWGAFEESSRGTGFSAPTVSGKANISGPATGEIIYDTSDTSFYGYNGST